MPTEPPIIDTAPKEDAPRPKPMASVILGKGGAEQVIPLDEAGQVLWESAVLNLMATRHLCQELIAAMEIVIPGAMKTLRARRVKALRLAEQGLSPFAGGFVDPVELAKAELWILDTALGLDGVIEPFPGGRT